MGGGGGALQTTEYTYINNLHAQVRYMRKSYMFYSQWEYLDAVSNIGVNLPLYVSCELLVITQLSFSSYIFATFHVEVKVKVRMIEKMFLKFIRRF